MVGLVEFCFYVGINIGGKIKLGVMVFFRYFLKFYINRMFLRLKEFCLICLVEVFLFGFLRELYL